MRKLLLLLFLLPSYAEATCTIQFWNGQFMQRYYRCLAADTPSGPTAGDIRFDTDTGNFRCYNGSWAICGGYAPSTGVTTTLLLGDGAGGFASYIGTTCPTGGTISALSTAGVSTCDRTTLTTTDVAANQGTTTTVLHGNAAGLPSWGSVALATDVSGILPTANGGLGIDTSAIASDRTLVYNGGWATPLIPDCDDSGGQHLNYNNVAGGGPTFSCGTSSSGSGSPGGLDTYIQFNDGGVFGGDADFNWDKTNNALGVGTTGNANDRVNILGSQDAATRIKVTNSNAGTAAVSQFEVLSDTGDVAFRSHSSGRVASQCGNTLGGTNDILSITGSAFTLCTLTSVPLYFSTGSTRRAEVMIDGPFRLVDSGAKPTCDASHSGAMYFDAGTPDTFEACTKDSGSVYAWRDMISGGSGGGLSYAQVAAAVLAGF